MAMTMHRFILACAAALLWPVLSFAQCPAPSAGPLLVQNDLCEIAAKGPGAQGAAAANIGALSTAGDASAATVTAGGATVARALAARAADTVRATDFGPCTWDAAHDVSTCIQAAIATASAAGGGDVIVPVGRFGLGATLTIGADLVRLISAGGNDGLSSAIRPPSRPC